MCVGRREKLLPVGFPSDGPRSPEKKLPASRDVHVDDGHPGPGVTHIW